MVFHKHITVVIKTSMSSLCVRHLIWLVSSSVRQVLLSLFSEVRKLRHMLSRLPKWAGCRVTAMTLEYPSVSGNISHLLGLHDTCLIENGGVQFLVRGRTWWNAPLGVFWPQTAYAPHIPLHPHSRRAPPTRLGSIVSSQPSITKLRILGEI